MKIRVSNILFVLVLNLIAVEANATIIINEIMRNPTAVSDARGEWFELFNPDDVAVDLFGWTIADLGTDSYTIGTSLAILPNGYLVLGRNGDTSLNGDVDLDYVYGNAIILANGADELLLFDAAGEEVDRVVFGSAFPDTAGASMALLSPDLDNSLGTNWAASTNLYNGADFGTPGMANFSVPEPSGLSLMLVGLFIFISRACHKALSSMTLGSAGTGQALKLS